MNPSPNVQEDHLHIAISHYAAHVVPDNTKIVCKQNKQSRFLRNITTRKIILTLFMFIQAHYVLLSRDYNEW